MNARVKTAVFMPIFATTTVEGPSSPEQLIEQMKAAGMMAGAWMVEGMLERLNGFDAGDSGMTLDDLGYLKGTAKELSIDLSNTALELEGVAETLSCMGTHTKLESLLEELQAEAEKVERLAEEARKGEASADAIYNGLDV